jgi:chemotaxis protein MotB
MSGHGGKRQRKHIEEEHENHERWMVSYADMMTLLMVLFLVLFAISTVDQAKFNELKNGLAAGFGSPLSTISGGTGPLDHSGTSPEMGLQVPSLQSQPAAPGSVTKEALEAAEKLRRDRTRADAQREMRNLEQTRKQLEAALADRKLSGAARFRIDERGLVVSIITDRVIFPADEAELAPDGMKVLDAFAPVLGELPNRLIVDGHTNTVNVRPKYFASEWELSTARASAVVRYLIARHAFDPARMEASGHADQRPLYAADDPDANKLNRRVEVVVVSALDAETRALLPESAKAPAAAAPAAPAVTVAAPAAGAAAGH